MSVSLDSVSGFVEHLNNKYGWIRTGLRLKPSITGAVPYDVSYGVSYDIRNKYQLCLLFTFHLHLQLLLPPILTMNNS